ncbi:hypothetical protein Q5752_006056 [Cryptotrichosporon argae]
MSRPSVQWIYKIFPHATVDSRFYFPTPVPSSHTFFLTSLDSESGFVHLCTASQARFVLRHFFKDVPAVSLLRIEAARVGAFKRLSWDYVEDAQQAFPHLHAQLEGVDIDSVRDVHRAETQDWDAALKAVDDWLV